MIVSESGIQFDIPDEYVVSKFDGSAFYQDYAQELSGFKAVDFVIASRNHYLFLEVKNCLDHEDDNNWRVSPNNGKRDTAATSYDVSDRDSLDIEAANKVKDTIAALVGVHTHSENNCRATECYPVAQKLVEESIHTGRRKIFSIVLLEGDFDCRSRNNNMVREQLQVSMRKKLKWLRGTVLVTTAEELSKKGFGIKATVIRT